MVQVDTSCSGILYGVKTKMPQIGSHGNGKNISILKNVPPCKTRNMKDKRINKQMRKKE
jgi:hypothetical protein